MHASCMLCGRASVPGTTCRSCNVRVPSPADEPRFVQAPHCPRCRAKMSDVTVSNSQGARAHICLACHGMFVPPLAWHVLLTKPDRSARLVEKLERGTPNRRDLGNTKFETVGCPACSAPMERLRFAGHSDVVIDVCMHRHGVWLDAGELVTIARFHRHHERVGTKVVKLEAVHREANAPNKAVQRLAEQQVEMMVRARITSTGAPPALAPPWWRTRTFRLIVAVAVVGFHVAALRYVRAGYAARESQRIIGEAAPAAASVLTGGGGGGATIPDTQPSLEP